MTGGGLVAGPPSTYGGPFLYEPAEVRARRSVCGGSDPRPGSPGGRPVSAGSMRSAHSVHSARDGGGRPANAYERLYRNAREVALKQERRRQARCACMCSLDVSQSVSRLHHSSHLGLIRCLILIVMTSIHSQRNLETLTRSSCQRN